MNRIRANYLSVIAALKDAQIEIQQAVNLLNYMIEDLEDPVEIRKLGNVRDQVRSRANETEKTGRQVEEWFKRNAQIVGQDGEC